MSYVTFPLGAYGFAPLIFVLLSLMTATSAKVIPLYEEVPLWRVYLASQRKGFYDLGDGRTLKAVIFQLGGCNMGHPCRSSSGLPILYPQGCPRHCLKRFPFDRISTFNYDCKEHITASNADILKEHFGNLTTLSAEWFHLYDTSCILRYVKESDTWEQRASGVAMVIKARGFEFPAQTVLVSDIDSIDKDTETTYLDFVQEAATNFALRGNRLLRPRNTYALDHYKLSDLWASPPILTQINVSLSRSFLDAVDMRDVKTDWVMGSVSAFTLDKVDNFPEYQMPKYWRRGAGGTVWASIDSSFDTWTTVMTLGRKYTTDTDQQIHIMPLKIPKRCLCRKRVRRVKKVRPIYNGAKQCRTYMANEVQYECEKGGRLYCSEKMIREIRVDGNELLRGRNNEIVGCTWENVHRTVFDKSVVEAERERGTHDRFWRSWPSFAIPKFEYPKKKEFY